MKYETNAVDFAIVFVHDCEVIFTGPNRRPVEHYF